MACFVLCRPEAVGRHARTVIISSDIEGVEAITAERKSPSPLALRVLLLSRVLSGQDGAKCFPRFHIQALAVVAAGANPPGGCCAQLKATTSPPTDRQTDRQMQACLGPHVRALTTRHQWKGVGDHKAPQNPGRGTTLGRDSPLSPHVHGRARGRELEGH